MTEPRAVVIHRHRDRVVTGRALATVVRLPWTDPAPPATSTREAAFVADLHRSTADGPRPHRRSDVTAVLNALRGGLTVARLLEVAPGLDPDRLLEAYSTLEAKRAAAESAWLAIVADPTTAVFARHAHDAGRLLPVPVESLTAVAATSPSELGRAVARAASAVHAARARLVHLEGALDAEDDAERAALLGALLLDNSSNCAYADDHHLPRRVGALLPAHVAALLSERRRAAHTREACDGRVPRH